MRSDIIVVGAGLAGTMAVLAAQAEGARVTLVDRGSVGIGTNSALANGVFSSPTPSYTQEAYVRDTLEIGRMINVTPEVEVLAAEAGVGLEFLRSLGLTIEESQSIYYVVRSPQPEVFPGMTLMKRLAQAVKGLKDVHIITGFYVTSILRNENGVQGVTGFDKAGKEVIIEAPAVVLACGGAGAVYLRNDNQKNMLGQGYRLAAQAGLPLRDMEFVQFIPIVMAEPGLPSWLLNSPFPQSAKLVDSAGKDVLARHGIDNLNYAVRNKRDELSILLVQEGRQGQLYLNYRDAPASAWDVHPLSLLKKIKFDFRTRPVRIAPAAHFFMGGIETDNSGRTSLPGLFACGEVVWGVHGANRRGGNALTECIVFGRISGYNAAHHASAKTVSSSRERTPGRGPTGSKSAGASRKLLRQVREIAWEHAGVVRSDAGLKEGLTRIDEVKKALKTLSAADITDTILREDVMSACFVVEAVLQASLARKESRGSFYREDFPEEDNGEWRTNSCLNYQPGKESFELTHKVGSGLIPF